MTYPGKPGGRHAPEDRTEAAMMWMKDNSRVLVLALVAILLVAGGTWMWRENRARQASQAWDSLRAAEQSLYAGNVALAQNDLRRVVQRFGDTPAGAQASLLLAQTHFDEQQYQEAITAVQPLANSRDEFIASSAHRFMGAAQESLGQFAEAAASYQRSAERAPFEAERAMRRNDAARAFAAAGNSTEAIRIWRELADEPGGAVAAEARLRLGELTARPAGQS